MKYVLILIFVFFFSLLFLPVKIEIKYIYNYESSKFNIFTSYPFGLFKFNLYPFSKSKKTDNTKVNIRTIIKDLQYRELINYIWQKSVLKEINWNTKIGFTDAFLTSIIYGVLWSLKSIVVSFILTMKEINCIDINVAPIFNENQLEISFDCIIKIRMVYIITVWIKFLKLYKGGEGNVGTSNRRVNENYNE